VLWVSVFRAIKGTGQFICPKNSLNQASCGTGQFLCLVSGLFLPPQKKRTPIPLAHLASGRAPPAAPAKFRLVPFFETFAKSGAGRDLGGSRFSVTVFAFLSLQKMRQAGPVASGRAFAKEPAPAEKRSAPIARQLYPSPRATPPVFILSRFLLLQAPTARFLYKIIAAAGHPRLCPPSQKPAPKQSPAGRDTPT